MHSDNPLGLGEDWWTTKPTTPQAVLEEEPLPIEPPPDWEDRPPSRWDHEAPGTAEGPRRARSRKRTSPADPADPQLIAATLRRALAAVDGHPASEVSALTSRILADDCLLEALGEADRRSWVAALEAVSFECSLLEGVGVVTLDPDALPAAWFLSSASQQLLADAHASAQTGDRPQNAYAELEALIEALQGAKARKAAARLIRVIDECAPAAEKMNAFHAIPSPTRLREAENATWARTAAEWFDHERSSMSGPKLILSSGYPTLDLACAGTGELPGLIRPGEFWVAGAGTGHGKSSFTRRVITAMTEDLVSGWGIPHARTILAFTEEEATDVARAAMLGRGQNFHHLAHNVVLAKVGESRRRLVQVLYDSIAAAVRRANDTGSPVTSFLPYLFVLDYIQAIKEPNEAADTTAVARTADLLMRGVAAWDPEMLASISGLDFTTHTGMPWPDGCEHHRVAVLVLSQLRKEGTDVWYRTGKSSISDFVVCDSNGTPCWEPLENDYAIPDRSDLRGSGVLLNHATGLIFLHRSQPTASLRRGPDGRVIGLTDTRARFIISKARKSVSMPYVPMRYDSNPEGFRGQFYDDLGHQHCVVERRLPIQTGVYRREGDPILPVRPAQSPFRGIRY